MNGNERSTRDQLAWVLVVFVLFPVTLTLGWLFTQAKIAKRQAEQERRAAEYRAQVWLAIINQQSSGSAVVDADSGEVMTWNRGAERILGWTESEVLGNTIEFMLPEDYREKHMLRMLNPEVRRRLLDEVLQISCWAIPKSGKRVRVLITVRGVRNERSDEYRFVLTFDEVDKIVPVEMPIEASGPPPEDEPPAHPSQFPAS